MSERVPFEVAIADPLLFKPVFDRLSLPQQTILKVFNGLPLSAERGPSSPWSELEHFAISQGSALFDELGYPTSVTVLPYLAKKYHTLVALLGRRSGKTDRLAATQMAYEAVLGGHERFVEPNQDFQMLFIAQDVDMAASHLNFIYNALQFSPLLKKEVVKFIAGVIEFKNGLKIVPAPPTIKSSRGLAVPGWTGDEVGFWYNDSKSANPDFEVERAVEYAMSQFPDAFKFIASTPYTKEGMLWKYHLAGTEGSKLTDPEDREEHEGVLVIQAPTAALENPRVPRKRLQRLQRKDPDAFIRESLAQFVDSVSGFLKPEMLHAVIVPKRLALERYPRPGHPEDATPYYVAAMDPAFRHDNFAFSITHHDSQDGIVQDYFEEWEPLPNAPLNPLDILTQIKSKLDYYGISIIHSDQYQLESLQQLAMGLGFSIVGVDFTSSSKAKIYGSLEMLVKQKRIKLLDNPSLYNQLVALEKKRTPNGAVTISAPPGKKDDAAAATCLSVHQCLWLMPTSALAKPRPKTTFDEGWEQIQRKRREASGEFEDPYDAD